jgi:hypothetical protein
MINNADYLIQKYAEAREKYQSATNVEGEMYWKGSMDTYHSLLVLGFIGWAERGTTGWYVFHEGLTYDQALTEVELQFQNC